MDFFNTKAKSFTVLVFSLVCMVLFVLSSVVAMKACEEWNGLFVGAVLLISAIPFHIWGKKSGICYIISFLLNSIGNGFSVSAYYIVKNVSVSLHEMFISSVFAVSILLLVYLMLQAFSKTKKVTITVVAIINGLMIIVAIVLWITVDAGFFSFGFFSLLISSFFLCVFGITVNHDKRPVLRDISFGSFGTLIILTVVVVTILSEGEMLEAFDFDIPKKNKKSKLFG